MLAHEGHAIVWELPLLNGQRSFVYIVRARRQRIRRGLREAAVLYVGASRYVVQRLGQHSREAAWWAEAATVELIPFDSQEEAFAVERSLIGDLDPEYNTRGRMEPMRIRQVKPEFWSDAKLFRLPAWQRLFYIGLWMEADDGGWLRWDAEQIAMDLMRDVPIDEAVGRVKDAGETLAGLGRLRILRCGHAEVPNLGKHQRLSGETRRVYTIREEHAHCKNGRGPAGSRGKRGEPRG